MRSFSMTGWRIGVAIDQNIHFRHGKFSFLSFRAFPFHPRAGIQAVVGAQSEAAAMRDEYYNRANS